MNNTAERLYNNSFGADPEDYVLYAEIRPLMLEAMAEIDRLWAALQEIEYETGETMLATNHGKRGDIANQIAHRTLKEGK